MHTIVDLASIFYCDEMLQGVAVKTGVMLRSNYCCPFWILAKKISMWWRSTPEDLG